MAWPKNSTDTRIAGIISGSTIMLSGWSVRTFARNLLALGIAPANVFVYERFRNQLDDIRYERVLPKGIAVEAAEERRAKQPAEHAAQPMQSAQGKP